jgi:uncharacterized LabA/DUF88 family protein
MSDNYAVMVDAGFLMSAGARALGQSGAGLAFEGASCVDLFRTFHENARFTDVAPIFANRDFLRAYWYDGAHDPKHSAYRGQRARFDKLASVPGLYLRLGHLHEVRPGWQRRLRRALQACRMNQSEFEKHFELRAELEQKGVDTLMTLDLVSLSRDRVVDAILLVSGDRDLAEAVRLAQGAGCKIVLAHPRGAGVAIELRQLADAQLVLDTDELQTMLVTARPVAAVS